MQWLRECSANDFRFTTMFDFYALPTDFPGYEKSQKLGDVFERVCLLESEFQKDIGDWRLVPYIQVHEFESLLFVEPECLRSIYFDDKAIDGLNQVSASFKNPELINGGWDTAPSKRILRVIPDYDKVVAGELLNLVGIEKLMQKCQHFSEWVGNMEKVCNGRI